MADYLTEEEQLERLKTWWAANGTSLLVGLALAIAGLVGWRWWDASTIAGLEDASDLYETYLAASAEERPALAERVDAEMPDTSYRAFTLLHRAKEAVEQDDIEGGIGLLQQVIDAGVEAPLKDVARIRQARLHQQQGDSETAFAVLGQVGSEGFRWQVEEIKGDIHLALGEREKAHEAYASAQAEAPEGQELPILEMKVRDTATADAT